MYIYIYATHLSLKLHKFIKQILLDFKGTMDNIMKVGDFDIPLSQGTEYPCKYLICAI